MSKGRFEKPKQKSKGGKAVLIILAVILVLVIGLGVAGMMYYNSILNKMNHVEVPKIDYTMPATEATEAIVETTEAVETEPTETEHIPSSEDYINILLVGQASREGAAERAADTMILVTLNTYEKSVTLTSFLRDSLVKPPDFRGHSFGKIKLTTVYHLGSFYVNGTDSEKIAGSMEHMNQTLYSNFGIEVDHNFEVDFDCFVKILDLIDGVEIELTQEEADYLNKDDRWVYYDMEPGLQRLDGMVGLSYARMRKATGDGDSDIKRTARQRKLITAVIEKLKTRSVSELQNLANEVLPYVTTSMTNAEITDLLLQVVPMLTDLKINPSGTCPVQGTYSGKMVDIYDDGFEHSVLTFTAAEQWKLMRAITEGEISD